MNPLSPRAAEALFVALQHSVWQASFIALSVMMLFRVIPMASANLRYSVGTIALLAVPGSFTFTLRQTLQANAISAELTLRGGSEILPLLWHLPWVSLEPAVATSIGGYLVLLWMLGVVAACLRTTVGWYAVQQFRCSHIEDLPFEMQTRIAVVSEKLGIKRRVQVLGSLIVDSPVVIGFLRPVVLVPVSMACSMAPAQVDAILAHELAHIRRHDSLVNLLQHAIENLFFYHPAVWWLSAQVRHERECACDELAVRVVLDRNKYARALADLESSRVTRVALLAANGTSRLI